MRGLKVKVYEWKGDPSQTEYPAHLRDRVRVFSHEATFLDWGVDCDEFNDGVASFSVALVMNQDGFVQTVVPDLIRFYIEENENS